MSQLNEAESFWAEQAKIVEAELLARNPENQPRPRLEPTARAVSLLGDPQLSYRVIHVTGTNGKTSTSRLIERILRETGLRTGRFTSPHLISFNERISIDGEPVSNEILVEVWRDIAPVLSIVDQQLEAEGQTPLTYFEAVAILGFAIFADAPVDVLVLEVGMGGEWDSTNVAIADVAVFTPIALDHTDRIGSNIAQIARTKSGIIKPGSLVVSAKQDPEAAAQIASRASELDAPVTTMGENFDLREAVAGKFGQTISVASLAGQYDDLFLPIHGSFQAENALLAIAAVESFLGGGEQRILDDVIRVALADVASPGRLQVIEREPLVIVDGAHNPHGAKALGAALENSFGSPETVAVVSMLAQKDVAGFVEALKSSISHFVVTQSSSDRAVPAATLGEQIAEIVGSDRVSIQPNFASAVEQAKSRLTSLELGAVLITGSLTLVGDALIKMQREAELDG